ncbi:MAG: TlpA family protein disulfide reductase [Phycisphaerales bacterium]|nr:TlpA family protein disulfide reductase [Phycisphaerales bacterium]
MRQRIAFWALLSTTAIVLAGCGSTSYRRPLGGMPPVPPTPQVGDRAPMLSIDDLMQAPPGASTMWSSLRGKVVVIEFWATWCAPCIAAMPHINQLQERFAGRPVVFIAVTDEGRDPVKKFLNRGRIDSWIGLDTNRSMFLAYRVGGIPHTVVVDGNGIIRDITQPMALREETIEQLIHETTPGRITVSRR